MPFYVFKTVGQQHSVLEGHMIRLGYPNFKDQTWVDGVDIDAYEAHVKVLDKSCIEDVLEGWANSSEE